MQTAPAAPIDPIITRLFSRDYADPLTCDETAHLLGVHGNTIREACNSGRIECQTVGFRPRDQSNAKWTPKRISKAAIALFLWKSRGGERALLRASLEIHAPQLIPVLERITNGDAPPATTAATPAPERPRAPRPQPAGNPAQLALF
jgi:hypothetical protein